MALRATWQVNLYCYKWCKNTVQPDLNTLDKIAKLLDVDVKDLLNSTEK